MEQNVRKSKIFLKLDLFRGNFDLQMATISSHSQILFKYKNPRK